MKKRNFRGFFKGEKGQRMFNYAYSLGASVVILGALFKLLHVPGADFMLILGMGTEAVIFALSAFDEPAKDYKWEKVYPELDIPNSEEAALERLERMRDGGPQPKSHGSGTVIINGGAGVPEGGTIVVGGAAPAMAADVPLMAPGQVGITPDQADQVGEATRRYVEQLNAISEGLAKLEESMQTLSQSNGYAEQMAALNRNVQGLNTIYEIQLKSVSAQLGTIEQVNAGLNNIRSLYENGQSDSFRIRQETDQLARNLQQLNEVYARMLQAMTAGYGFAAQQPQAFQPSAQPFQQSQPTQFAQR